MTSASTSKSVPIGATGSFQWSKVVERCIEIARECLHGDPFRRVPELEKESIRVFAQHEECDPADELTRFAGREPKQAFKVAAQVLETACTISRER